MGYGQEDVISTIREEHITDDAPAAATAPNPPGAEIEKFADSYSAFSRVINSLQRKYLELKDSFEAQNDELADANRRLVDLSRANLAATGFLNSILSSMMAGVIAVDHKGRVTHCNPAAGSMLGVSEDDILGQPYDKITAGQDEAEVSAVAAVRDVREDRCAEKELILADGRTVRVSATTSILRNDHGQAVGAVEVFHDITKFKRMEQELARLNTLAALGEMAATVAHEVRNPLSGIAGFAALLDRDLDCEDPNRNTVRKIIRGVENLNQTVATLLNYTRFKEISKRDTNWVEFLDDTVEQFQSDFSGQLGTTGMAIKGDSQTTIELSLDPVLIRQALFNIMSNAVQVTDGKGRIEITYRLLEPAEAARRFGDRVLLGSDETLVETVISDNGPGIHKHNVDKIFAPFFSTRSGGNGLGLAVVWKIVKTHGGEVFAADPSPSGAAFHLLLPARIRPASMEPQQ